jgi:RimJ/RimL family protein N-acetyltransferase
MTDGRLPVEGVLVRLRDVMLADAETVDWLNQQKDVGGFNDFDLPFQPTPRDALARGALRNEYNGTLLIETLVRAPVGTVQWRAIHYGPPERSRAWNIGIELEPRARGRGYGTEAQRLLAAWLFAATDTNRVEAQTDVENVPEQRSLEKAGFTREGITRGCQFRGGTYHDLVMYSRIRSDP